MKIIRLIAGHTRGAGEGAQNQKTKETENRVAGQVLQEVSVILAERGVQIETFPFELTLRQKIDKINQTHKNHDYINIELHLDSSVPRQETGALCYYYGGNADSKQKAQEIIKKYCATTGITCNGARADTQSRDGRLGIIRDTKGWAFLLELGSINNDLELVKAKGVAGVLAVCLMLLDINTTTETWGNKHFASLKLTEQEGNELRDLAIQYKHGRKKEMFLALAEKLKQWN
jgi:N-acetylmuramoyl-L-alanine amidase